MGWRFILLLTDKLLYKIMRLLKFKKNLLGKIVIALIIASSIVILSEKGVLSRLELGGLDLLFHLRGSLDYNPHIVIIEIDDENISRIGRWPWERSWHAAMVEALTNLGAKVIFFDIIFSEVSLKEDDDKFSEAIEKAGNVYLPFAFQENSLEAIESAYPQRLLLPIEKFSSHLKGTGAINIYPDIDGVVRKVNPLFFSRGKESPDYHAALQIAMDYAGLKVEEIEPDYLLLSNAKEKVKIPLLERNKMLLNWSGKWEETFKHYSFLDILSAYQNLLDDKKPQIDLSPLKDSICLVAVTTAIGVYDIKPTPLEPNYPAVGINATTISNILDNKFITTLPGWTNRLFIFILALIPSLFISGKRPLREILTVTPVAVAFFITCVLFFRRGIRIDFSSPLVSILGSYLAVATYNLVYISIERQRC